MGKTAGTGTLFQILSTSTGTGWATIANVRNIDGPELQSEMIDVTTHASTGGFVYREQIPSFLSGGNVTLDQIFDTGQTTHGTTTADGLVYNCENRQRRNCRLKFPTTANRYWKLFGYVSGFSPTAPLDEALTASATVSVDGGFTWSS